MTASRRPVQAGGMYFRSVTAENAAVHAVAQRAILWQRDSVWELHIQPRFQRGRGAGAWVVPFPVEPVVEPSSPALFNQLELLTAPLFVDFCVVEGGGHGNGNGVEVQSGEGYVEFWQEGEVGELDFTVLSASDGDVAMDWLETHGYAVDAAAQTVFDQYQNEEVFFFVGRLDNTMTPAAPLAPVRFVLPGLYPPTYPLRLSTLGLPAAETVDLTLWIVFSPDEGYVPSVRQYRPFGTGFQSAAAYGEALETELAASDELLIQFAGNFGTEERFSAIEDGELCIPGIGCLLYAEVGLSPPQDWRPEIDEMTAAESWVYRYRARLSAAAMDQELTFRSVNTGELPAMDNFYRNSLGVCAGGEESSQLRGCNAAAGRSGPWKTALWGVLWCVFCVLMGLRRWKTKRI
jgi:hypothetical protein